MAAAVGLTTTAAAAAALNSDEVLVTVPRLEGGLLYLGCSLEDVLYRGGASRRCVVKEVKPGATADVRRALRKGFILESVNGEDCEGLPSASIVQRLKSAPADQPVELTFRDPELFFQKLNSTTDSTAVLTTVVLPASKGSSAAAGASPQVLRVERLEPAPRGDSDMRSAALGDVLEVSFRLSRLGSGEVLQSSGPPDAKLQPAGAKMSELSQFFVLGGTLGKQGGPGAADPPLLRSEALLTLRGMRVGELRAVEVPAPLLSPAAAAAGKEGVRLEVRLLSLNGVA